MAYRQTLRRLCSLQPLVFNLSRSIVTRPNLLITATQRGTIHSHRWTKVSFHTTGTHLNEHIINIQDTDDFRERVLNSTTPVIVDFHATWCGPCKLLGPRLESKVAENGGKVILAKVDIDEIDDIPERYGVRAVPTVVAVKGGVAIGEFVGLADDDQLDSFIAKLVGE